mmetsp:Transcript_22664/g.29037  ORF Transcript_22664/g.29037 Transcript_22664/m.29037 type:complete len:504 (-) Transcript_22664:1390-2901(-)|eukprot:CAMPEP_0116063588 /NCGR_PEP_ID=MMETSP0322-20121206/8519_1 /TAXON_ID=163516 /ORGANISM="Leptocylindrus danicus var. apora, Strain B651" /LENGTH=503 /DNA_ID=CAMNT_0003549265 /DNA_START=218 /DNA_END=1729 /DNA_ORIENTATION=+
MTIDRTKEICNSVLDAIGETPMIRLNNLLKNLEKDKNYPKVEADICCKCEYFNAGGSVKDRIGKQMVEDAEKEGLIKPGDTLIEPTSGNTGIGIALAAAVKGYRCIICLPEKMSKEKVDVLKALGAEIVRTPTEAAWDAPDSHISVAKRLHKEIANSHILDQYKNPSNPNAHYEYTAEEIWRQCGGNVDMLVAGAGTGGTITGIAEKLREYNPNIMIVGVDPEGSILAEPDSLNDKNKLEPYHVEGIGYDFIPHVLDRSAVDEWIKSNDKESLVMMRKLIREEGILCGGSSGSAVACAIRAASKLKAGQRCVVILPDSVRNYMTKALSNEWMIVHGFVDNDIIQPRQFHTWWASKRVCDLVLNTPLTITSDVTCKDAIQLLKEEGFDMVPVVNGSGDVLGVVTEGNLSVKLLSGRARPDSPVADAGVVFKTFRTFAMNDSLSEVAQALDHEPFTLVVTEQRCYGSKNSSGEKRVMTRSVISGIVTRIDLLDFISREVDTSQVM